MIAPQVHVTDSRSRRFFLGGSDARLIMGIDEVALMRLWQEKRGEIESEDLSDNLIVQLGTVPYLSVGSIIANCIKSVMNAYGGTNSISSHCR
jgi:hypothetical protein